MISRRRGGRKGDFGRLTSMHVSVLCGVMFLAAAMMVFSYRNSPVPWRQVFAVAGLVFLLIGLASLVWALKKIVGGSEPRWTSVAVLSYLIAASAGTAFLALIPDPVPFISTITSVILSVLVSAAVGNVKRAVPGNPARTVKKKPRLSRDGDAPRSRQTR